MCMTHDDKLSAGRAVGLIAGFIGVVVLIGPDMLNELGTNVLAELACLAAAAFYAFGAVLARRLRGLPPIMMATGQLTMSTVCCCRSCCCSIGRLVPHRVAHRDLRRCCRWRCCPPRSPI